VALRRRTACRGDGSKELFGTLLHSEVADKLFGAQPSVGFRTHHKRQRPSRANHWIEQPPRGNSIAKFQPVCHDALDPQVLRQRAHHMLQTLADEHHLPVLRHPLPQTGYAFRPELSFQNILKIFLAEQVQPVAAHAAQQSVQNPRRQHAVGGIKRRAKRRLQEKPSAPRPSLRECVSIPGEIRDRPNRRQRGQAAFHAPEDRPLRLFGGALQRHTRRLARLRRHRGLVLAILGIGNAQDLFPPRDETARLIGTKENVTNLPCFGNSRNTLQSQTVRPVSIPPQNGHSTLPRVGAGLQPGSCFWSRFLKCHHEAARGRGCGI
jgi:hypothetical protein